MILHFYERTDKGSKKIASLTFPNTWEGDEQLKQFVMGFESPLFNGKFDVSNKDHWRKMPHALLGARLWTVLEDVVSKEVSVSVAFRFKGGPGSGHRGHAGRLGKRGGSLPGKGGPSAEPAQIHPMDFADVGEKLESKVTVTWGSDRKGALDASNAIVTEREKLLSEHPKLKKVEIDEIAFDDAELRRARAVGLYDPAENKITIQSQSATGAAREMAQRRENQKRLSSTCTDVENIYRHELGHAVQSQLLSESDVFTFRDEWLDVNESKLATQISKYAVSDPDEAFSEMFNLIASGRKTEFTVLPEMQRIINEVLE